MGKANTRARKKGNSLAGEWSCYVKEVHTPCDVAIKTLTPPPVGADRVVDATRGEVKLCIAIIDRAARDLFCPDRIIRKSAWKFFFGKNPPYAFSFRTCCQRIGWDERRIRAGIIQMLDRGFVD